MTVEPGLGGQDFLPDTLPKISEALTMMQTAHPDNRIDIAVDGGIKSQTIGSTLDAGATTFISGSGIFAHPDGIKNGVQQLRDVLASSKG